MSLSWDLNHHNDIWSHYAIDLAEGQTNIVTDLHYINNLHEDSF